MRLFTSLFTIIIAIQLQAQSLKLPTAQGVILTADSAMDAALTRDLSAFLAAADLPNEQNIYVLPTQQIETYILLDEILGITKNPKTGQINCYQPVITNCIALDNNQYLIQVAYMGGDSLPTQLRAIFEIIAHANENSFLFSSPLKYHTQHWNKFIHQNTTVFYKRDIQTKKVEEYATFSTEIDAKLKSTGKLTEFYCCENFVEVLQLIGVLQKADYASIELNTLGSLVGNKKLIVTGEHSSNFNDFDKHDLWHDRLSLVVPRSTVNKPVDEACAYLYGGSWGYSWDTIFKQFTKRIAIAEQTDWQYYKENPYDFGESDEKHLYVDYVVNALIVQHLEKEYGFDAVWKLLNTGKYQKGNDNYYAALQQLTGVSADNYNQWVYQLVKAEMNKKQ
ncbi:MAG TPA: hypothetical protein PLJ00_09985 [Chitinophagales bacterium]|nr:hypothetical protein [Chitinophagales bacterium]HRG86309.1 hypothetical protein [Chitinophagales bacterium]HRH52365.1 hypothetical protein [Chitinophagales bacterium]